MPQPTPGRRRTEPGGQPDDAPRRPARRYLQGVMIGALLFGLALFWCGVLFTSRGRTPPPPARNPGPARSFQPPARQMMKTDEARWLNRLMTITRGNREAIERGVTARRRKFPRATRAELLEMVYTDYLRDRQ